MNYAQVLADYEAQLAAIGEEPESLSFTFRKQRGLSLTDFVLLLRQPIEAGDRAILERIFQQLSKHIPAQYIIGEADFYGLSFKVDKRVLIPRPETEELVDLVLAENPSSDLSVLDMGTGSGAIAISVAHCRSDWQVTAVDISKPALELAVENAQLHHVELDFQQSDVFERVAGKWDIIVSNPPYISKKDKEEVGLNVLHSEPHLALFAEEEGLAIYRRLAEEAAAFLTENGKIYLEIGYKQGQEVAQLFAQYFPDKRIRVLQDQFGQDRKVVVDNG